MSFYKKKVCKYVIDINAINLDYIMSITENDYIYVLNNDKLYGVLGHKERNACIKEKKIVINKTFSFIESGSSEIERLTELVKEKLYIKKIPVLKNGKLLYEYECDIFKYYSELQIKNGLNTERRKEKIIISLTSHGKRLNTVHLTIKSLMSQTMKPDLIVLYLNETSDYIEIKSENELKCAGLQVVRNVMDIKPHKKYYFAMQEYFEDIIVTVDDDVIYPSDLIEKLYSVHCEFPDVVIGNECHRIVDDGKNCLGYKDWNYSVQLPKPSHKLLAVGVGGVLYPRGEYRNDFLKIDYSNKAILYTDDLWLKFNELVNDIKIMSIDKCKYIAIPDTQDIGLYIDNLLGNRNDKAIRELEELFGTSLFNLIHSKC